MRNKMTIIILCVIILLTVGLFLLNRSHPNDEQAYNERELYQMGKDVNEHLTGRQVADVNCADSIGNIVKLSDLIANKSVLIYHYSELHCSSCYESFLRFLGNNVHDNNLPIIILGSYLSFRHFSVYIKRNVYMLPIYRVEHNPFQWELDNMNVPYCFVLNPDMTSSYFYIPRDEFPETNKLYLERVRTLLSTN